MLCKHEVVQLQLLIYSIMNLLDIKVSGFNSACLHSTVIARWSDIDIWTTSNLS